jgi:hypothetical protein
MRSNVNATLGAAQHGGVLVRIESSNPAVAQISPNTTTAGSEFIDLNLLNGQTQVNFVVQGVEGATGTVNIRVSANGFTDGIGTLNVVQPALVITGLASTILSSAANDPFQVRVGIPSGNALLEQDVRAGSPGLVATVVNSNLNAAQLVTTAATSQQVSVSILAGQSDSPSSVALGGVALDPLAAGMTTVSASVPGFTALPAATVQVTVNP